MEWEEMIVLMLKDAPDPDEPLPVSNRKATIYGTTIPFLIISLLAVSARLYTRFRIVREPGWDDFFVTLAASMNTMGTICVLISTEYGLGQHLLYIPVPKIQTYLKLFYIENATYISQTAIIKISLLIQYLRIFRAGTMRYVCLSLLVVISLWGLAYGFMAWFPCFPPSAYWSRMDRSTATCYGYGYKDPKSFIALFESHTAMNMLFDLAVFLTPMALFKKQHLSRRNYLAMTAVFLFGAVVCFISIWRLYGIVSHRAATDPYIDFTWWPPISILLSCLEISLAITCASVPIFWPVLESRFSHISVTHEVHVTEHRRLNGVGLEYELEHNERTQSIKSTNSLGGTSEEGLTRESSTLDHYAHYKDQFIIAQVDPLASEHMPGTVVETVVNSEPKPKWRI